MPAVSSRHRSARWPFGRGLRSQRRLRQVPIPARQLTRAGCERHLVTRALVDGDNRPIIVDRDDIEVGGDRASPGFPLQRRSPRPVSRLRVLMHLSPPMTWPKVTRLAELRSERRPELLRKAGQASGGLYLLRALPAPGTTPRRGVRWPQRSRRLGQEFAFPVERVEPHLRTKKWQSELPPCS